MTDTPEKLMKRVAVFDDTGDLCEWLLRRAEQCDHTSADSYYLKEVEASLSGLYDLAQRMAKALEEKEESK